jgi:hypothetical protein
VSAVRRTVARPRPRRQVVRVAETERRARPGGVVRSAVRAEGVLALYYALSRPSLAALSATLRVRRRSSPPSSSCSVVVVHVSMHSGAGARRTARGKRERQRYGKRE